MKDLKVRIPAHRRELGEIRENIKTKKQKRTERKAPEEREEEKKERKISEVLDCYTSK